MGVRSCLAVAALFSLMAGPVAMAQTAQYDYTADKYLSYGPRPAPAPAPAPRGRAAAPTMMVFPAAQYDWTGDKYLSYGKIAR
jgi:hypothetical protein